MVVNASTASKNAKVRAKSNAIRAKLGNYKAAKASGVVRDDESFSIDSLAERLGTTRNMIYDYEKEGLPIRKRGNRCRISGREFNEWWNKQPLRSEADSADTSVA